MGSIWRTPRARSSPTSSARSSRRGTSPRPGEAPIGAAPRWPPPWSGDLSDRTALAPIRVTRLTSARMRTSRPASRRWVGRGAALLLLAALPGVRTAIQPPLAGASTTPPNVLVIVTDDQRINTMHQMPQTRELFAGGGTSFPHAFVTTPLCCPSRASIFTGEYAHNHGVWHNSDNGDELAQLDYASMMQRYLQIYGYATGIVGKYLNGWDIRQAPPNFDYYALDE